MSDLEKLAHELKRESTFAIEKGICVECGCVARENGIYNKDRFYSDLGMAEFEISGICEVCFDLLWEDEDE